MTQKYTCICGNELSFNVIFEDGFVKSIQGDCNDMCPECTRPINYDTIQADAYDAYHNTEGE